MLNMEDFSEPVVGQPGEGIKVEQHKLLTIETELAAKPALLLFLNEPTHQGLTHSPIGQSSHSFAKYSLLRENWRELTDTPIIFQKQCLPSPRRFGNSCGIHA
ncbi:hypothetical protein K432DRAFT_389662 [Lepidopterella palustris CBS 459.81]|uniref:Uncharacterized protein n=1 Tax=Lepidopterella palustris CBS 459.81 TaxID=1314670 RepID=A0A8E2EIB4_9PEZI|nr:hypothetical protein K432DRAFT_389662 [Lepidopterella palustris CBS 459.81]